ncbi:MAG: integrase arm-type DNA-binding domain-containing protein [Hydrogenophaga sp.]|nr:integrase arm-type DNA-binding domain-containing protein [Hydrogenophaga sp.]
MPLTDVTARQALPKDKDYKLSVEKGLYLLVRTTGAKYWRMKYRFAGKEKTLALGVYPDVSLKLAKQDCERARVKLSNGIDPSQIKQTQKSLLKETHANSFQSVATEWFAMTKPRWTASTAGKQLWILEKNLFPWIGSVPLTELKPTHILTALRRIESRGAMETAHRAKQVTGQVFRYAVASGLIESDPTRDLSGALAPKQTRHHPALTDPIKVGKLMRDIDRYQGTYIVRALLAITPLVFQRPGEIRQMEWQEIDFEKGLWEIPATKMKMKEPHIVPLCKQAINILKDIHPLTSWGLFVFPNERSRKTPVSDGTVNKALRNMGYTRDQMTAHGFRAMGRTILDEVLEFPPHLIEQQISHAVRDPLGRAYNRTSHLPQRIKMMQTWGDYLEKLKSGAEVLPLRQSSL